MKSNMKYDYVIKCYVSRIKYFIVAKTVYKRGASWEMVLIVCGSHKAP